MDDAPKDDLTIENVRGKNLETDQQTRFRKFAESLNVPVVIHDTRPMN